MTTENLPEIVSRDEWLAARKELLTREKEAVRAKDALNTRRRLLPMVRVSRDYRFDGPAGPVSLLELFDGERQLVVQHFMFDPEWEDGCGSCTAAVDELSDGLLRHLRARSTVYVVIARAPLAKLEKYRAKRGWSIPLYSSYGSDFNYDFHATTDESVCPVEYNYRSKAELQRAGQTYHVKGEQPGTSVFLREGDQVFHSYSSYGRGLDTMLAANSWLDITPFGRGEGWDGMPDLKAPVRHHDRYDV